MEKKKKKNLLSFGSRGSCNKVLSEVILILVQRAALEKNLPQLGPQPPLDTDGPRTQGQHLPWAGVDIGAGTGVWFPCSRINNGSKNKSQKLRLK